ncbi:O-antigen ligase family protein [Microbacterium lacus]|uniref:O-antigen ligase family protein n=1 Tax=Microbacterium lacus TaxID=415217 RepID=UPI00384B6E6D
MSVPFLVRQRLRGTPLIAIGVATGLLLSSLIGIIYFGVVPERMVGLAANIMVWLTVAAGLAVTPTKRTFTQLTRAVLVLSAAQGAITLVATLLHPARLPVPLLAPIAESLPSGFAAFARNSLVLFSWLDGEAIRSAGLNAQPTWAGAFAAIALIIATYAVVTERGGWRALALVSGLASIYSIQMSLSRATWIALAAALVVMLVVSMRSRFRVWYFTSVTMLSILVTAIWITSSSRILAAVQDINSQREGSATARGDIYEQTWSYIRELPIPIFGFGIKPGDETLVASVATHSTYLGLIFRGGFITLVMFILLLACLLVLSLRASAPQAAAIVVFVGLWCIFEDIDPGHLVPLGIIWALWFARTKQKSAPEFATRIPPQSRERTASSSRH